MSEYAVNEERVTACPPAAGNTPVPDAAPPLDADLAGADAGMAGGLQADAAQTGTPETGTAGTDVPKTEALQAAPAQAGEEEARQAGPAAQGAAPQADTATPPTPPTPPAPPAPPAPPTPPAPPAPPRPPAYKELPFTGMIPGVTVLSVLLTLFLCIFALMQYLAPRVGVYKVLKPDRPLPEDFRPGYGQQQSQLEMPEPEDTRLPVYDIPQETDGYTTQYIVEQVQDSVVGILMYDNSGIDPVGAGTGIVMSEDGLIITNAHVVVDTTRLTVVLRDESKYTAIVLGYDEKTDLAVIQINAEGLQPAQFGNSDQVVVGERAIAIGNPGGLAGSVSQGIISGKNREISIQLSDGTTAVLTALQTDAAINPGNSGGPLLNAYGQVVGINSSKIVRNGYEGIGFAIPVNEAQPIIENLIQYGYVKDRAVLGITIYTLDAISGPANGLPSQGLYIDTVMEYSDLRNHGVVAGDVILKANGVEMTSSNDLSEQLKLFRPGDRISMEILHTYDNTIIQADVLLLDSRANQTAVIPEPED